MRKSAAGRGRRLLHSLAASHAFLDQNEIVVDVGIIRISGLGRQQDLAGARIVGPQDVRIALVVENFRRFADDANGPAIGAISEIEPLQPIIACGETDPRFGIARMRLNCPPE